MGITESIKIIANMIGVEEDKINIITNTVYLKDRVNTDDCRKLLDLGFPIFDEIAKLKDCTKEEAKDLVISGKITAVDYNNIMLSNYHIQKYNDILASKEKS